MNNLAIITARSGSKGLVDKNIKHLNGMPLMAYSILAAKKAELFTEVMVSTDSEAYAMVAKEYGASVPFLRTGKNSSDSAGSWEVVKEVLYKYRQQGRMFDTVCLLQPTSPLRTAEDIISGYRELAMKQADAITAVCEVEHSPVWMMELPDDLSLRKFRERNKDVPRQQLNTFYRLNGALYIRKISYTDTRIEIESNKEYAYIMNQKRSIDIDTIDDFEYAEYLMIKGDKSK